MAPAPVAASAVLGAFFLAAAAPGSGVFGASMAEILRCISASSRFTKVDRVMDVSP